MRALVASTLAAIAVQPLLFAIWFVLPVILGDGSLSTHDMTQLMQLGYIVLLVAAAFVIVLGVPTFFLLRRLDRGQLGVVAVCGLLISALPVAILDWPLRTSCAGCSYSATWHGSYVDFEVNGAVTLYGWLNYLEGVVYFGLHGVVGAIVFLLVWRRMHGPNNALERTRNGQSASLQ
jgi:hypothetical protein